MPDITTLTDEQRRHLAHIYAGLRECITDEVAYDRGPTFAPLDDETQWAIAAMIAEQLSRLMFAAQRDEAEIILTEGD